MKINGYLLSGGIVIIAEMIDENNNTIYIKRVLNVARGKDGKVGVFPSILLKKEGVYKLSKNNIICVAEKKDIHPELIEMYKRYVIQKEKS